MDTLRIAVAIDFTESSDLALAEAGRLAKQLGARLDLVHVCPLPPTSPNELIAREPPEMKIAQAARAHLQKMAAAQEGLHAEAHLRVGTIVMSLLDMIEQLKPSFIVVGSHGKGLITRALVGSVAESLIRRSPVPVLVVPSPRRRAAAERAAWSCRECGHILGNAEGSSRCAHCGSHPAQWISAPISSEPIDAGEASIGEVERETVATSQRNDPTGLFSTSPAGTSGYDVNPELRVRY